MICDDYLSDRSISCLQLAQKYSRDPETIRRILKKHEIDILPNGSSRAKKIWVYDAFTNELLMETYINDFVKYLKENNIVQNAQGCTVSNHIKRKGNVLYKKFRVRDFEERL